VSAAAESAGQETWTKQFLETWSGYGLLAETNIATSARRSQKVQQESFA
jgi:hypothetical protein